MGKKKITSTVFTKEKLLVLAEKYGLDYKQYEECFYFYLPKLGILEDENEDDYRDDLFDWTEGQDKILIYTSYMLRIGIRYGWENQFEHSEEVCTLERLEAIVSYMVEMANSLVKLKKKANELSLALKASEDFQ